MPGNSWLGKNGAPVGCSQKFNTFHSLLHALVLRIAESISWLVPGEDK